MATLDWLVIAVYVYLAMMVIRIGFFFARNNRAGWGRGGSAEGEPRSC